MSDVETSENVVKDPGLTLFGNSVLVKPVIVTEKVTDGGIVLRAQAQKRPLRGTVIATGHGLLDVRTNTLVPMEVSIGDDVLYNKFTAMEISVAGVDYLILQEEDILMIIEKDESGVVEDVTQFATSWNPPASADAVLAANGE